MDVTSNGLSLPFDERYFAPLRDSSELLGNSGALRQRYHEEGQLYLRQVLDREAVLELRHAYFALFDASASGGRGKAGTSGGARALPAHGVPGHPAHAFVRSETFARFMSEPTLYRLAEALLESPVEQLPRWILRHFSADAPRASRAHIDADYFNENSDHVLTFWIPLGDCPLTTGGLVYLDGSHRLEPERFSALRKASDRPQDERPICHDLGLVARKLERRWLWADYAAGDITIHSPRTVHASLDTLTKMNRVSIDTRFVRRGEPIDPRWTRAWSADDGN
jgi:ectoine hydroxylase-related dioxygenase (phytanoyl-CoA dioxygenase family)